MDNAGSFDQELILQGYQAMGASQEAHKEDRCTIVDLLEASWKTNIINQVGVCASEKDYERSERSHFKVLGELIQQGSISSKETIYKLTDAFYNTEMDLAKKQYELAQKETKRILGS